MPDILIERKHTLGLAGAREAARRWMEQIAQEYGLDCSYAEGPARDVVQFNRAGIDGTAEVTADRFTLEATLGFLFSSFGEQIEQRIARKIDALLGSSGADGSAGAEASG